MKFIRNEIRESALSRGLFIASGAVSPVEIAAECGFDWLLLDMEHGLGDEHATLQQITALKHSNTAPIVRIPTLAEATIKRILDFGASGIMAPMIESREEAERLVRAMRYPPEGIRGLSSGSRAADYGFDFKEYFRRANRELLCIAQIESEAAVRNIDSIASVEGIDVLFIGHSDLSLGLGCYNQFDSEAMRSAEKAVIEAARKYGKTAGMLLKPSMSPADCIERGFRFLAMGTDHNCMKSAFRQLLER